MDEKKLTKFCHSLKRLAIARVQELSRKVEVMELKNYDNMTNEEKSIIDITRETLKLNKTLAEGL